MRIFKNKVTFLLILFATFFLSLFMVGCTNGCSACGNYELKLSFDKEKEGHYRLRSVKSNDNTKVEIPSTYNNLPVKEIGYCAFLNCDKIKEIILPDSITYISGDAFVGCDNLRYNEKDGLRYLGTRDNPYYALMGPVENSIIHANITDECVVIAYNALYGCNNLVKVTIGSSVKHISTDLSMSNSIVEVYNKSTIDVFNESIFGSNFKNR